MVDGNTAEALDVAREIRVRGDEIADRSTIGWSHYVVARALSSTDPARALVALDEARAVADEVANPNLEISSRRQRASALITGEDPEAAEGRDPLVARSHTRARRDRSGTAHVCAHRGDTGDAR